MDDKIQGVSFGGWYQDYLFCFHLQGFSEKIPQGASDIRQVRKIGRWIRILSLV